MPLTLARRCKISNLRYLSNPSFKFVASILRIYFFQVGGFSYKEDGSEEMESLRNQRIEEEAENFVFEESGNENNDKPDVIKSVTISVGLCDKNNHSKESASLHKSTV